MGFSRFSVKFRVVVILHEGIDSSYSSFVKAQMASYWIAGAANSGSGESLRS